jgi:type IV pilus assembly protein PilC
MSAFLFQAKTQDGKFVKGEVEASSESEARVRIRAQKLTPLKIVPKRGAEIKPKTEKKAGFSFGGGVNPKELQVFTRQLATLIGSGVPVVQSLEAMIGPGRSPVLNSALKSILSEVGRGRRLAECLREHPKVFDNMYVNLVHAGEEGGVLDTVLSRLATYIEKSVKLKGKIKGALAYPVAVIVVAALVVAGIMLFVIPSFEKMFKESGMQLPWLTQKVIGASNVFVQYWWVLPIVGFGVPAWFNWYYSTPGGRRLVDSIAIRIPLFGELIIKGSVARFSRTLATMLGAGVRIVEALDIAAAVTKQWVIEQILMQSKDSISKGKTLSEPIKASGVIPDMVGQMIMVGEQTGSLDTMLDRIASFYEEEVETTADALTSVIEPLMMIFLGGIIACLVVAMYLPVFNLAGASGQ